MEKRIQAGIHNNPNDLITNLTNVTLLNSKIEIFKYGLKHGLATRPKESEMIVIMEDIYEQILQHNAIKDNYISKETLKTTLKAFAFNYLDIDDKRYIYNSKSLKVLRQFREKFVILKPDKGQGIVLVNHADYVNLMERMFVMIPLTKNQYVVKDSFTAANMIRLIPKKLFDQSY